MRALLLILALAPLAGCLPDDAPRGLRRTPAGDGPRIHFDLDARPLPDIPFPNDVATRPDPDSPTGLRLNLPIEAATEAETRIRELAHDLDGFGTFAPITVSFDAPLDVVALDGRQRAPEDDPVLLVDLTEGETFGERVPLDLGRGVFPLVLPDPAAYFDHDPRAGGSNLVFETFDEDTDGDGRLDPGEDTDGDGLLDAPNVLHPGGDPTDDLLTFYERQTNTLILRPVVPLRSGHRYAVVLTEAVRGADGKPVRSPFPYVHHLRQTGALERLGEALAEHGLHERDIAFAWSFTTQSATETLVQLRQGLAGLGPFAELATRFPPQVSRVELLKQGRDDSALLRTDEITGLFRLIGPAFLGDTGVVLDRFVETFEAVDHLVAGRFVTPYLLVDDDGHAAPSQGGYPGDDDEFFRLDPRTGEMVVGADEEVPFWCTIPKAGPGRRQPFPVVLFAHGFGGSRLHSLGLAGTLARWGLATCALDAVGHGMVLPDDLRGAMRAVLRAQDLCRRPAQGEPDRACPLEMVLEGNRARDLDNDGVPDPGGDTFSTDALHTRDVIRQSVLDWMQFIRVLRGFDGRRWAQPGGVGDLAGDWDADGTPDVGGPEGVFHFSGISYGALLAGVIGGVEPHLTSVAPISGGGGLSDIGSRSTQAGVPEAVILRALGPLVVGDPAEAGVTAVRFVVPDVHQVRSLPFASLPPLVPGDRVVLTNLRSGESSEGLVDETGAFRVAVAVDALDATRIRNRTEGVEPWEPGYVPRRLESTLGYGDPLRLEIYDALGSLRRTIDRFEADVTFNGVVYPGPTGNTQGQPLVAVAQGWGLKRQSPALRRFTMVMQTLLEPADPITWARHHFREPLDVLGDGSPGASVLSVITLGDTNVPVATGVSFARAAGLLPLGPTMRPLIDLGVVEGLSRLRRAGDVLADPDDLSDGTDGHGATRLDPPLRITAKGPRGRDVGVRFALIEPQGAHGFAWPRPDRAFDVETYLANLLGQYFTTGSAAHRPCLATNDCPDLPR